MKLYNGIQHYLLRNLILIHFTIFSSSPFLPAFLHLSLSLSLSPPPLPLSSLNFLPPLAVKPILRAFSSQLRWAVNSNALLQTLLVDANPDTGINVQWLDPSSNLINDSQYSTSTDNNGSTVYQVTLPSLGENDGGIYTCVVENIIGSSRRTFNLFITRT